MVWGGFPIDRPPLLTIQPAQTVRIDTISHSGATNATLNPVQYFGQFGVKPEEVLQDVIDFWESRPTRTQYGPHILTGPIYIEGAEPGDSIEIQVLDLNTRVPFGINNTSPTGGVMVKKQVQEMLAHLPARDEERVRAFGPLRGFHVDGWKMSIASVEFASADKYLIRLHVRPDLTADGGGVAFTEAHLIEQWIYDGDLVFARVEKHVPGAIYQD